MIFVTETHHVIITFMQLYTTFYVIVIYSFAQMLCC